MLESNTLFPGGPRTVVYAEVCSVEADQASPAVTYVTLDVKCKLNGVYDAAASPVGACRSSSTRAPGLETRVPGIGQPRPRRPGWSSALSFPWGVSCRLGHSVLSGRQRRRAEGPMFVEVTGLDDPKVAGILARLTEHQAALPFPRWHAVRDALDVTQRISGLTFPSLEVGEFLSAPAREVAKKMKESGAFSGEDGAAGPLANPRPPKEKGTPEEPSPKEGMK